MSTNENKLRIFGSRIINGDPVPNLTDEMRDLRDAGVSSNEVLLFLETLRMDNHDDPKEDIILELMDYASGFCSPNQRIWPCVPE